jgi:hypothetical protein
VCVQICKEQDGDEFWKEFELDRRLFVQLGGQQFTAATAL